MATDFKLPDLGENVEEGDVVGVLVSAGDVIEEGQTILELETGKATLDIPCDIGGSVKEVLVKEGEKARVGQVVLRLEGTSTAAAPAAKVEAPKPATETMAVEVAPAKEETPAKEDVATGGPVDITIPELGENIEEGQIVSILVAEGDSISADQPLLEIETGKATIEVPSELSGTVSKLHVKEGDKVNVGQAVLTLDGTSGKKAAPATRKTAPAPKSTEATQAPKQAAEVPRTPVAAPKRGKAIAAAPSVRKFAREIGVIIDQVEGSGPRGRISIDDVKAHAKKLLTSGATSAQPVAAPLPDFSKWGEIKTEPMNNVRRMTVEHMTRCWSNIPHVTQFDKADVTNLESLRKKHGGKVEAAGGKLTITSITIKILANVMKEFPKFSASIDTAKNEVIYKNYCHIGIAVDTPKGLVVPVIRDADQKTVIDISVEIGQIAKRAREGKIKPDEMQGGCLTVSNLGGLGGKHFAPIVNFPEVAILGMGRAAMEPVYIDGAFEPRFMAPLSLSYDHRLIDGADGTRFMRALIEALEEPFLVSLSA